MEAVVSYLEIILDHLNIQAGIQVGGKVNKKKRIVHMCVGVLHSFLKKKLYYEQIHLYMWIKIKLFVVASSHIVLFTCNNIQLFFKKSRGFK